MKKAYIIAAQRTAVVPRGGPFSKIEVSELVASIIRSLLEGVNLEPANIDTVILGNALYGGGNPARVASLLAGLPDHIPASTIDTQCCSGMDAIGFAMQQIHSGQADVIIAGGVDSFSRSPIRKRRPLDKREKAISYQRPPFTPWPDRDPDMLFAAAQLAEIEKIRREDQEAFAIRSHKTALLSLDFKSQEIVPLNGISNDQFTRDLSMKFCHRLNPIAGNQDYALTASTVAVEADAAAAVLIVSDAILKKMDPLLHTVEVLDCIRVGGDPTMPALAAQIAAQRILERNQILSKEVHVVEIMEAFAVQAMVFIKQMNFEISCVNRGGGALARGHPIGASGAINIVRLWHELQKEPAGSIGMASIAAAGGLASAFIGKVWS